MTRDTFDWRYSAVAVFFCHLCTMRNRHSFQHHFDVLQDVRSISPIEFNCFANLFSKRINMMWCLRAICLGDCITHQVPSARNLKYTTNTEIFHFKVSLRDLIILSYNDYIYLVRYKPTHRHAFHLFIAIIWAHPFFRKILENKKIMYSFAGFGYFQIFLDANGIWNHTKMCIEYVYFTQNAIEKAVQKQQFHRHDQ